MSKKTFLGVLAATLILCSGCGASLDYKVPLAGGSIADEKLQQDTLKPLYLTIESAFVKGCKNMSVYDTKVIEEPSEYKSENGENVNSKWKELWSVNACGQNVHVPISFFKDPEFPTFTIQYIEVVVDKK